MTGTARPLSAEDRLAIMDLIADYAFRLDSGDLDGYVDNFTPDAVATNGRGRIEGREAIRDWLVELNEQGLVGAASRLVHVIGIPSIHGDGERCRAEAPVLLLGHRDSPDVITFSLVGAYLLEVVRQDGRWRFAERGVRHDLEAPGYV